VDIRSAQKLAWQNKVAKGFNTTDVPLEFCLLQGEMAEAFDAWRKGQGFVKVGVAVRDSWGGLTRPSGGVPGVPGQPYSLL